MTYQPSLDGMPEVLHTDPRLSFSGAISEMGRGMDIPRFEQLDGSAVLLAHPRELQAKLYDPAGTMVVDGLALNAEEYSLIVRSPDSFQTAIQAKTIAANRSHKVDRARAKAAHASHQALDQKIDRYDGILKFLQDEHDVLDELSRLQQPYGYSHTTKSDILAKVNQAWNFSFRNILDVIRDQHGLSTEAHHNLTNAVSYQLFRGPQSKKMQYWGEMLQVADNYNHNKFVLFRQSQRQLARRSGALALQQIALTSDSDEF